MAERSAEETLGAEFWTQPEGVFGESPIFNLMHANIIQVFRDENTARGGSVIDLLVAERIATMYTYVRFREAGLGQDLVDRTRREMNKDVIDVLTLMKKLWLNEDKDNAAEAILKKVNLSVANALKDLPEGEARHIQRSLAESFEASGL